MKRTTLGRTGIEVSEFCLGTMTWGSQNSEAEGHAQIDMALDHGVDFLDTAEMYPTNPVARRDGGPDRGDHRVVDRAHGRRDDLVIATKITGRGNIRGPGGAPITAAAVRACVEASLRRLRTDRIDLYQLHWPNRGSYHFRQNWGFDPSAQDRARVLDEMREVAVALKDLVAEGKIRAFGLSNESAWGTMAWLRIAEETGAPRVATVQNEYSLLCRLWDTDMAETGASRGRHAPGLLAARGRASVGEVPGGRGAQRARGSRGRRALAGG
jgi:aryl-alcohol dehydrogenase-like predicted oxidoreductase